jgi:hypothetical protein
VNDKSRSRSKSNPGWFPKGRSGNPGGRPTTSRASQGSVFDVLAKKTLTVTHHGAKREITTEKALRQETYREAVAGERMAMREVVKWIMKRDDWLAKHKPSRRTIQLLSSSSDPDNADAALLLLGIAAPNPARADIAADRAQLLLEPWAVQAALRRRRGGNRLTDSERDAIRHCARDPESLRWPRGTDE